MNDENDEIKYSPLSRKIKKEGKTVEIQIYYSDEDESKKGGWILEIVDQYWNSTVYSDLFDTDQKAFEQALNDIEEEVLNFTYTDPGEFIFSDPPCEQKILQNRFFCQSIFLVFFYKVFHSITLTLNNNFNCMM